jgi:hypothetical protein
MQRTHTTFSMLQAVAAVATFAVILWSLGFPQLRFAEAANVTFFSDTLSDSAPSVVSNHTITFVTPTGLAAGNTITLTFPTGFTGIGSLQAQDLDMHASGTERTLIDGAASGASWNVTAAGQTIDITSGTSTIGANATVTIEIGTHATTGGTGDTQITNPATTTSYEITVDLEASDSGTTMVAIVDSVTVTASVPTLLDFTINGVASTSGVNGATTTASTTSTSIPFGVLAADDREVAAQDLIVSTNAANGFIVTVTADQQLTSNTSDIDGFQDGTYTTTPTVWAGPSPSLGDEDTYGHWGLTTNDGSITAGLTDPYDVAGAGDRFVSASTTPVEVFRHNGPTNGTSQGVGTTRVGYAVEVSSLQEAAEDYTATLTYVATPIF